MLKAPTGFKQFAEVNANSHGTLSQEVRGIGAGNKFGFSFYHRGRHSETEADTPNNRIAFQAAKIPAPETGWTPLTLDADGKIQYQVRSPVGNCTKTMDLTYFQNFVTISDVTNVKSIRFSWVVDDHGRLLVNDQPYDFQGHGNVELPASSLKNDKNRIVIVLVDQCVQNNFLKNTLFEIVPKP